MYITTRSSSFQGRANCKSKTPQASAQPRRGRGSAKILTTPSLEWSGPIPGVSEALLEGVNDSLNITRSLISRTTLSKSMRVWPGYRDQSTVFLSSFALGRDFLAETAAKIERNGWLLDSPGWRDLSRFVNRVSGLHL